MQLIILLSLLSNIVEHCRSKKQEALYFFLLTTIVTMLDNHFIIFMCATDNLASPIVNHCQTLSL